MKKLCCLFAALLMLFSACAVLAEERVAPADRKELVTELAPGVNSLYRIYDARFWEAPSTQPGTIVRFDYTTDVYGEPINQWANVYLPYGYDENKQYNIMYFTHGTNETQESFICNEQVKNAVDNMIEMGICEPFIMVCPTYYYEYESRSTDHKVFVTEVRKDLMPAVEAAYSTYAETMDDAGFIASREHRAFAGYSQGSSVCWTLSYEMYDRAKWFLPMSIGGVGNAEKAKAAMENFPEFKDDVFYYLSCGGARDLAYKGMTEMTQVMLADDFWSFGTDPEANNFYYLQSNEIHQTLKGRFFLYNAFIDCVFK